MEGTSKGSFFFVICKYVIIDSDDIIKETINPPLTPELLKFYDFRLVEGVVDTYFAVPGKSWIKLTQHDALSDSAWLDILEERKQRFCYSVRIEMSTSTSTFILFTIKDLQDLLKMVSQLEANEAIFRKKEKDIYNNYKHLRF